MKPMTNSLFFFFFFFKGEKMKMVQAGRGVMVWAAPSVPLCPALPVPSSTSTSALPPAPLLDSFCWLQGLYTAWTSELPLAQEWKNYGGFFPFTRLPKSFLLEHSTPSFAASLVLRFLMDVFHLITPFYEKYLSKIEKHQHTQCTCMSVPLIYPFTPSDIHKTTSLVRVPCSKWIRSEPSSHAHWKLLFKSKRSTRQRGKDAVKMH